MSYDIFLIARKLIKAKRFEDARTLLRVLGDDPRAARWLSKIDDIDPPTKIIVANSPMAIIPPPPSEIWKIDDVVEGEIIPDIGKWMVATTTNEIDDTQTITAMLNAEPSTALRIQKIIPALALRWRNCELEIFLVTHAKLVSRTTESATVRLRFDKLQPTIVRMGPSTTKEAYFFSEPRAIFRQIIKSSRIVFSYDPLTAGKTEVVFDLNGLTDVVEPIKAICGKFWL